MENQKYYCLNQNLNGTHTVLYPNHIRYTGVWVNGLKTETGILENHFIRLKVKIKNGEIYKCIELLDIHNELERAFPIPNIKIVQEGGFNSEYYSKVNKVFFYFCDNKVLFDGKPYSIFGLFNKKSNNMNSFIGKLNHMKCAPQIIDLKIYNIRIIGYSINFNLSGKMKIIINDVKIKSKIRGFFFNGPCIIKTEVLTLECKIKANIIQYPIRIYSKILEFDVLISRITSLENLSYEKVNKNAEMAHSCRDEIKRFLNFSCLNLNKIINSIKAYNLTNRLISCLLIVKKNWLIFEKKISERKNILSFVETEKNEAVNIKNEKCFISFQNKERFEGIVVNGKFEGFGKYDFADGSVYVGEFKNNLRNGLGTFKFCDGRTYKGYWLNGVMHGKGCMVNEGIQIYGIWVKNEMIQKGLYIVREFK